MQGFDHKLYIVEFNMQRPAVLNLSDVHKSPVQLLSVSPRKQWQLQTSMVGLLDDLISRHRLKTGVCNMSDWLCPPTWPDGGVVFLRTQNPNRIPENQPSATTYSTTLCPEPKTQPDIPIHLHPCARHSVKVLGSSSKGL